MAKADSTEIDAQLNALRLLTRDTIRASKGATPLNVRDTRSLRRRQRRAVDAIDVEIDRLKQLRRRVLWARIPDGLLEKFRS